MPYTDFTGGSTRLTPDWFSGLASSLGDAIENRRAGRLLSDYVDSALGPNPTADIDYAGGLGRPPSGGGTAPADYADSRMRGAFQEIGEEGGATGRVIPERYRAFFETAGRQYGFDPATLARQAEVESGFNPNAVSPAGAVGISQFMPQTARRFGIDPRDPQQSIMAQAEYNALNRERFGGNEGLMFAAYNWGEGNVQRWLANGADPSRMKAETRDYVQKNTGRPIEAWLQGTQTAMGAAPVPGTGDRPGARPGAPGGFLGAFGAGSSDYPMPDRDTLKAMARNKQLRPLVVDILKTQRKGGRFEDLPSSIQEAYLLQQNPDLAAVVDRNVRPPTDPRPAILQEYEYAQKQGYKGTLADYTKEKAAAGAAQLPAEMGARIGLGRQFLSELPGIRERVRRFDAGDFANLALGRGEAGEIWRRIETGRDALVRNLTGAGMGVQEAQNQAARYQISAADIATGGVETMLSKLEGLERDLRATEQGAIGARTGDLATAPPAPPVPLPGTTAPPSATPEPASPPVALPRVSTIEEALALPPGTRFVDPDGVERVR